MVPSIVRATGWSGALRRTPPWAMAFFLATALPAADRGSSAAEKSCASATPQIHSIAATSLHAARLAAMDEALANHRLLYNTGGWGRLADGPVLRLGSEGSRVVDLRRRLERSGDHVRDSGSPAHFDVIVDSAVRRFQRRHGLDVDGIVGPATKRALNVPVETRVRQLEAAREAWEALPPDLGTRSVVVNIPAFEVEALEAERSVLRLRAVVGRTDRPTTAFSSQINAVALRPYWNVPPGITRLDVLPAIRRDPAYLARNRMRVFDRASGRELNSADLDWDHVNLAAILIRQEPGGGNPMGQVKITFPNDHHVFIHDTPDRHLFDRTRRAFSSACIRVERALDLTDWILARNEGWDRARIDEAVTEGRERWVTVRDTVPIHLVYLTAWVDAEGVTQFRHDLYGRYGFP